MKPHSPIPDDAVAFTPRLAPRLGPWIATGLIALAVPVVHLLVVTWRGFNPLFLVVPFLVYILSLYLFLRFDRRCPDVLYLASGRLCAEWHDEDRVISAPLAEVRLFPAGSGAHYQVTMTGSTFPISAFVTGFNQLACGIAESGGYVDSRILDVILKRGLYREFGPKTDPSAMTDRELLNSAKVFFAAALVALVVFAAIVILSGDDLAIVERHPTLLVTMVVSVLVFLMGVLGGIYLAIADFFGKRA